MAYQITYTASISFVQQGGGQAAETPNGSVLTVTGIAAVPGGATPTAANITTGCTAVATALTAQLATNAANLAQLQAFATGGN